jgi:hypothetical protein
MIPPMLVHSVNRIQELKQSKGCTVAVQFFGTGEYGCALSLVFLVWAPERVERLHAGTGHRSIPA